MIAQQPPERISGAPAPSTQFELLVNPRDPPPLPTAPDEIASLVRRLDALDQRLLRITSLFRQQETAREIGVGHRRLTRRLSRLRDLAEGAWCLAMPPRETISAPLPRISVVTPVLNAQDLIANTIQSVLDQAYPDLEYILVDGGSTDGTRAILESFADRLALTLIEPDEGPYDALSKGFARATGEIFAWLNAGDLYLPGALDRVGQRFAAHPQDRVLHFENLALVGGWRFAQTPPDRVDFDRLLSGEPLSADAVFFRRVAYDAVGGIDRRLMRAGDAAFWLALARRYPIIGVKGHVSGFRLREDATPDVRAVETAEYAVVARMAAAGRSRTERWVATASALVRGFTRLWGQADQPQPFHFPIDWAELPPADAVAVARPAPAPCPITGTLPDRFLFSRPDVRGDRSLIQDVWFHTASEAVTIRATSGELAPVIATAEPSPDETAPSPFRAYAGQSRVVHSLAARLVPGPIRRQLVPWADPWATELGRILRRLGARPATGARVLDLACGTGDLLDRLQAEGWRTFGCDVSRTAVAAARAKGHEVWLGAVGDALRVIPSNERFDLVLIAQHLHRLDEPLAALQRAARLLASDGLLYISTPNLNSAEIDRFGPTWAHWQPSGHRHIFSRPSLATLAAASGLRIVQTRTWSHPDWCWLSLRQNALGLATGVRRGEEPDALLSGTAERRALAQRLFWNWRGRGDYLSVVLQPDRRA